MTLLVPDATARVTSPTAQEKTAAPGAPAPGPVGTRRMLVQAAGPMTTVLAIMLLMFVASMVLLGPVTHARQQAVLYQEFRAQMANGVAPTGQLGSDSKPVPIGDPVALMAAPSIGLKEVIAEGTTSKVLMSGPGHRRDTVLPGQAGTVVIYGRQATYGGPFKDIDKLEVGAEIAFATGQGKALYKVTGIRHDGDELTGLVPGTGRLTLITGDGTPYLPGGVVRVDAELTSQVQPSSRGPFTAAALTEAEGPMKGYTGALLPLLLWSQLLLIVAVAIAWVRESWGRWQTWMVAVPVLGVIGFAVSGLVAQLLPNLI